MFFSDITRTTDNIVTPEDYVNRCLARGEKAGPLQKHVLARVANLFLAPTSLITRAMETIIGLGAGIGAICTLGMHRPTLALALKHISESSQLVTHPYIHILRTVNPQALFPVNMRKQWEDDSSIKTFLGENYKPPRISAEGDGFISDIVIKYLTDVAKEYSNSDNFLKRHVASRLTYALLAVSCIVTRVFDGIIGIPAAGLSILTVGKFESLNNLAYRGLQAPGIIKDLFCCTIKVINPWAEPRAEEEFDSF